MHAFTFTRTSTEDFVGLLELHGFQQLKTPPRHEIVFAKRLTVNNNRFSIRVYTALNADGSSRPKGADAIRCQIWACTQDGRPFMVRAMKRTMRVLSWRVNLVRKIEFLQSWAVEQPLGLYPHLPAKVKTDTAGFQAGNLPGSVPVCPKCGSGLTPPKVGRLGIFRGCQQFPRCRGLVAHSGPVWA